MSLSCVKNFSSASLTYPYLTCINTCCTGNRVGSVEPTPYVAALHGSDLGLPRRARRAGRTSSARAWSSTACRARIATYLADGGLGFELGDGQLSYAPEWAWETYYDFQVGKKSIWITPDFQLIGDLGDNGVRGPVAIMGVRVHAEF